MGCNCNKSTAPLGSGGQQAPRAPQMPVYPPPKGEQRSF